MGKTSARREISRICVNDLLSLIREIRARSNLSMFQSAITFQRDPDLQEGKVIA